MIGDASDAGLVGRRPRQRFWKPVMTANLYLRKTLVADDAWEQTLRGHHGPSAVGPRITDVGRADHGRGN